MSLQLQPDQLLTALQRLDHPLFPSFLDQLLSLTDAMADAVVEATPNTEINQCSEFWDDMVCAPISAIDASLPIPDHLKGLDDHGWE